MNWEQKCINFGILKVVGKDVQIYCDQFHHTTLSVGEPIVKAEWAGNEINVYLTNGKVRKYKDHFHFITI